MNGEAINVSMAGSLFEVRRRVAASLEVPEHLIGMVTNSAEDQIAIVSGSVNADVEKGSEIVQPRCLTGLDLLSDACAIGGDLTVLLESGQRDLRVGDEVRAKQDLQISDLRVAVGSRGNVESMSESDGVARCTILFASGSLFVRMDAWTTTLELVGVEGDGIVPRRIIDEVEETMTASLKGALCALLAAVLISVIPVPLSLVYRSDPNGIVYIFVYMFWWIVFVGALVAWSTCAEGAINMAFKETTDTWLCKASVLFSVATIPLCLAGMYLLADYGDFGLQMRGVLQYNVTSNTLFALHGNGAAGIFDFEHGPSTEHAIDSSFWPSHPFTGTHHIDVPCHLDVVGKKDKSASSCPGYVHFALMPFRLSRSERTLGSNRSTAFVFQYRVFIFNPWERDIRNRDEQKNLSESLWSAPDRLCAFDTKVPVVNALWSDYLANNLTIAQQGIQVDQTYDLPAAWVDGFVSNARHNLSIPLAEELPLLWMPPTAGSLFKSVEEQVNWSNSRGLWGVSFFAVAICFILIASLGLFVMYSRSLGVRRRIQKIQSRCT